MQVQAAFLGPMELFLILVVALLLFGPRRLPEIGRAVGQGLKEFRGATGGDDKERTDSKQG